MGVPPINITLEQLYAIIFKHKALLNFFKNLPSWIFDEEILKLKLKECQDVSYNTTRVKYTFEYFNIVINNNVVYYYDNNNAGYHLYKLQDHITDEFTYATVLYIKTINETLYHNCSFLKSDLDKIKYMIQNPQLINFI